MEQELKKLSSGAVANQVADLMEQNRVEALKTYRAVFALPNDIEYFDGDHLAHHRRLSLQLHAAESFTANQIRVDDQALRAQNRDDWLQLFNKQLAEAEARLPPRKSDKK